MNHRPQWLLVHRRRSRYRRAPAAHAGCIDSIGARGGEGGGVRCLEPDACLINRYVSGAQLSLRQNKDERDYETPIVSVSFGMKVTFLLGGHERSDPTARVPLCHGDAMVWGSVDRLSYHGVMPLKDDQHPLLGNLRINLTFRQAG